MKKLGIILIVTIASSLVLVGCGSKEETAAPVAKPSNDSQIQKTEGAVETPKV